MSRSRVALLCGTILTFSLVSCASQLKSGYPTVDWSLLERRQEHSSAMELLPEIEIYGLRILLIEAPRPSAEEDQTAASSTRNPTAQAGVDLGNGLAIDVAGNVFLDIAKLVKIEKTRPFDLRYGAIRLWRDSSGLRYAANGLSNLEVQLTDTSEYIVSRLGKTGYTQEGDKYRFTGVLLQTTYEMTVDDDTITTVARRLLTSTTTAVREGDSINFGGVYTIRKSGDVYLITCNKKAGLPTYSLYVLDGLLYFCDGTWVQKVIEIRPNEILVNRARIAAYTTEGRS